jgi:hypothetical protein
VKKITVQRTSLLPKRAILNHQKDVESREQAFKAENQRRVAGRIAYIQPQVRDEKRPSDFDSTKDSSEASDSEDGISTVCSDSTTEEEPFDLLSERTRQRLP